MVPEPSPPPTADASTDEESSNTVINAVIGAAAGIILSFIPLSTLVGGAIAGYLEDSDKESGLKVDAIAGLIMLLPLVGIGFFSMMFVLGGDPAIRRSRSA